MLRYLCIRHLAVIDHLEVEFEPGLNALTGETGAGKSIVVEAIDLLLGGRASADLVRTGEDAASVQAIFERADGRDVIVRREVSSHGRSRAFIDDALATTAALRELGAGLVDLHGQHEHQALLDPAEHLDLLDAYADLGRDVAALGAGFDAWRAAAGALNRTRLDDREKRARIEMASFHLADIDKVNPAPGEDETLAAERTLLANRDRLSRLSAEAYTALYDGDGAALASLGVVWKRVADLAALDARFEPHLARRDDVKSVLDDLAFFLRSYAAGLDASPERLQHVEDRLAALERVKKKHGPALGDVIARRDALRDELAALDAPADRVESLVAAERQTRDAFRAAAERVSDARRVAAPRLGRALERALADLAMPTSRFEAPIVSVADDETEWTARGIDCLEFLISPNPGEDLRPLARIASGGELSRVMLALRTIAGADAPGRTLIFDEVDAGIGGTAASAVAARLHGLSDRFQVLVVTHLPQIAARASTHFQISKHVHGGRTLVTATKLDASGREGEVARMIAGAQVTSAVRASAREMIGLGEGEAKANLFQAPKPASRSRGGRRGA